MTVHQNDSFYGFSCYLLKSYLFLNLELFLSMWCIEKCTVYSFDVTECWLLSVILDIVSRRRGLVICQVLLARPAVAEGGLCSAAVSYF